MVRLSYALVLCGAALFAASDVVPAGEKTEKKGTEFTSKEHKFSAVFPAAPMTKKQAAGPVTMTIYFVDGGSTAHFVFHQENPAEAVGKEKEVLEGAKLGMSTAAKIIKSTNIKLDGKYPGIEVYAEKDGKTIRDRVYVVGNLLYQVMVVGDADFVDSPESNRFMKSFKHLP